MPNIKFSLAQLDTFIKIVDAGTFAGAAQLLFVSPPSVSQRIQELEEALQVKLFIRKGPRVFLTSEGKVLLASARAMLAMAQDIEERYREDMPLCGILRLGVTHAFALYCTNLLLTQMAERYPQVKVSILIVDRGNMLKRLMANELDMAMVINCPDLSERFQVEALGEHHLTCVAGPAFGANKVLSPSELACHHLMIAPKPSQMYLTISEWFNRAGVKPSQLSACNDPHVVIKATADNLILGILPKRILELPLKEKKVREVGLNPKLPVSRVSLCYSTEVFGHKIQGIAQLIRQLCESHRIFS